MRSCHDDSRIKGRSQAQVGTFLEYWNDALPGFEEVAQVRAARYFVDNYSDRLFSEFGVCHPHWLSSAVVTRRAEFLAGRLLARKLLTEQGIPDYQLRADHHRCPLWPAAFVGSLSHSGTAVICTLGLAAKMRGLGVDIEQCFSPSLTEYIRAQFLDDSEYRLLKHSGLGLAIAATIVFSSKESIFIYIVTII